MKRWMDGSVMPSYQQESGRAGGPAVGTAQARKNFAEANRSARHARCSGAVHGLFASLMKDVLGHGTCLVCVLPARYRYEGLSDDESRIHGSIHAPPGG